MQKFYSQWFIAIILGFLLIIPNISLAHSINLTIDQNPKYSQDMYSDFVLSGVSAVAYGADEYGLNHNIFYRFGLGYLVILATTLNHELGHTVRVLEQGQDFKSARVRFDGTGETSYSFKKYTIENDAIIATAGIQASSLFADKIKRNLIENNQKIDPVISFAYIFSATDLFIYAHEKDDGKGGNDITDYVRDMQLTYGKNSITREKIKTHSFLDLLDPVLYASLYSACTGEYIDIPALDLGLAKLSPFAKSVPMPYGVLETKIGLYILTEYTPVKLSVSFGSQNKNSNKVNRDPQEQGLQNYFGLRDNYFNGLLPGEPAQNHNSYNIEFDIFKLYKIHNYTIGAKGVIWNQPKMLVEDLYRAKTKKGIMLSLTGKYQFEDNLSFKLELGYKQQGFVVGQPVKSTPIIRAGLEWQL